MPDAAPRFHVPRRSPRVEDPPLLTGRARFTDDVTGAEPGARGVRARAMGARDDPFRGHNGGARDAGRAGGDHGPRPCRRGDRRHSPRPHPARTRRQADAVRGDAGAGGGARALRGRTGGARRRGDVGAGAGRGGGGRRGPRSAARRRRRDQRAGARRDPRCGPGRPATSRTTGRTATPPRWTPPSPPPRTSNASRCSTPASPPPRWSRARRWRSMIPSRNGLR